MHGDDPSQEITSASRTYDDCTEPIVGWSANDDGSIACPPLEMGGCGGGCLLELKRMLPEQWISNMEVEARRILDRYIPDLKDDHSEEKFRVALPSADREDTDDNNLYSPHSSQIRDGKGLVHFKEHWITGEPVVVRDVLQKKDGLSWEPMVMWRALCENVDSTVGSKMSEVKAIDCLSNCEVWCTYSSIFLVGAEHFTCNYQIYASTKC